jgi:perosamine synthetase
MKKISWSEPDISSEDKTLLKEVVDSEWYSQGKYSKLFEKELCNYTGAKYSVILNNGTSSLIAAMLVSKLKKGDEILVPSFTFIATINSLLILGLKPVLVDCDKDTFNVTVENLKEKITSNTKAVLAVDVYGMSIDIDSIKNFCNENNLILIEDSAEALGAEYNGKKTGGFGHLAIFSFHIAKICTAIEGGAITTDSEEIYNNLIMIREHGMLKKYDYEVFGLNFKSTDINCALGYSQLLRINKFFEHRNNLVNRYKENLKNLPVDFQKIPDYVSAHPYMIFGTLVPPDKRDLLNEELNKAGIDTRICWIPCHKQMYHSQLFANISLPNSEMIASKIINPPMGNRLTLSDVDYICDVYKKVLK